MQNAISRVGHNAERFLIVKDAYVDSTAAHYGFATELLSDANEF